MSSIIPPLDYIPKLPPMGVNIIITKLNDKIDELISRLSKVLTDVVKLPEDVDCDDPSIKRIKSQLNRIIGIIQTIQRELPKIQNTINQIKTIVQIARTIKSTITAAQLLNPVTAPLFIANQLMLIQDQTIVNSIESLKQFQTIPSSVLSKLGSLMPQLLSALNTINSVCNGDTANQIPPIEFAPELFGGGGTSSNLPSNVKIQQNGQLIGNYTIIQTNKTSDGYWLLRVVETDTFNNIVKTYKVGDIVTLVCPLGQIIQAQVIDITPVLTEGIFCLKTTERLASICSDAYGDIDFNDLVETEFYNELNVSDDDLEFRSDTIEELLRQQQDLLKSLLEAPSKVYQGQGLPNNIIGKVGDYYVDTNTNQVYGPKTSINSWT